MAYREMGKKAARNAGIPDDVLNDPKVLILRDSYSGAIQIFKVDPKKINKEKAIPYEGFELKRERDKMRRYFGEAGQPLGIDKNMARRFFINHGDKDRNIQEALCLAYAKFIGTPDKAYRLARSFDYLREIWIWRAYELLFEEDE